MMGRWPSFLVIGAMKAGTTSLYHDLSSHPAIFMPRDKEPGFFRDDSAYNAKYQCDYMNLFASAEPTQMCGEASTYYTMIPRFEGVPQRVRAILGKDVKLIYIVRHPVSRTVSHYCHMHRAGYVRTSLRQALLDHPELLEFSRYHRQLTRWLDIFSESQLRVIIFEDYVIRRHDVNADVQEFLGVAKAMSSLPINNVYNRGESQRVLPRYVTWFVKSSVYQRKIRPFVNGPMRDFAQRTIGKKPRLAPVASVDVLKEIGEVLLNDTIRFEELIGRKEPIWNLHQIPEAF